MCPNKANTSGGDRRVQLTQEEDCQSMTSYHTTTYRPVDPEQGVSLMFNRTLLQLLCPKEPPQIKNLFRTHCKVLGMICKVIVDSSSIENLVSNTMIDKLGLKKIPHPNPYRVSWLNKDQQTLVDEQCWVAFQIGEYKDKVLCEVINMDACHLLLGRPLQYDVNSQHEGKKNVYTLTKNGISYTMTPFPDCDKEKPSKSSVMLVGEKEFLKVLKEKDTPYFSIIIKPKTKPGKTPNNQKIQSNVGPKEVAELLGKYKGLIVDKSNDILPPKRSISHYIDFIPSSTLPNKAAYKLTPAQNAEVARKIQELMEKGFIRKSISPCVVPIV